MPLTLDDERAILARDANGNFANMIELAAQRGIDLEEIREFLYDYDDLDIDANGNVIDYEE